MKVKQKIWKQFLPLDLETVWAFFSRPENLDTITPEDMSFEILSDISQMEMYPGMIVQYRVKPFPGVKLNWVTEITHVADRRHFIDEQRFGPYAFWHHQHHFEAVDGGVMMTDILHYKVPFGFIGALADMLLVDNRIEQIFSYRKKAVAKVFNLEMAT